VTVTTKARKRDVFSRASLQLLALFAALVVVLIAVSGFIQYLSFSSDLRGAIANRPSDVTEQDQVNRSLRHFRWQLIAVDGVIIVVIGGAGLWYARRTLRPIRESATAQQRFMADASHELRTPLSILRADFDVALRQDRLGESARPSLESWREEVDLMSGIVDDLLTLSRIDAHQEELLFADVDASGVARAAVAKLEPVAAKGGVQLTVTAPEVAVTVSGDTAHLERALRNVIKNAVEASPPGAPGRVTVARHGEEAVTIVVADEGHGIAAADLPHIFDRFFRADSARSRDTGGSGLGLAIVLWTVRRHGGDVDVSSTPGKGTTMTIVLPARSLR
jgi:two-component system, OmpR family, sensor histidine kinase CiaH